MKLCLLLKNFGPPGNSTIREQAEEGILENDYIFPGVNSKALSLWVNFSSVADSPNRAKWMGLAATHLSIF